MHWFFAFAAWGFISTAVWSLWAIVRDTIKQTKQLHQIPCSNCLFFTDSYYLKCPVHPHSALTEEAINCPDYFSPHANYSVPPTTVPSRATTRATANRR